MDALHHRKNNVGLIRLIFALFVIISHSAELVDGNRSREILTRIFGTLSLGEVGVDGFFLLSGFLITQSFQRSRHWFSFLSKRVLRIYPGYIVAYVFSLLVVARMAGAAPLSWTSAGGHIASMIMLDPPKAQSAFAGLPYPALNGSLLTISFEMRCYLLLLLVGLCGILRRRLLCLAVVAALMVAWRTHAIPELPFVWRIIGNSNIMLRFGTIFCAGGLFYLFNDKVRYTTRGVVGAAILLFIAMFSRGWAEPCLTITGGYLLFFLAFQCGATALARLCDRADLSYGIYLYAWPVQNLLIYHWRGISPFSVAVITILVTALLASVSWYCVERPFLRLGHRARR